MKGIILAGGTGSRLWPMTRIVSKQLLPVHDKPMIYYPLSTLLLAGVREVLIITTPAELNLFKSLLGDGANLGVRFEYATQEKPEGLAQAFIIAERFIENSPCLMILGDNIFHGVGLGHELANAFPNYGAHIFTYEVQNPNQYGILTVDSQGKPVRIDEKPDHPESNLAVTGLYYFDSDVSRIAKLVKPSKRGELEITSVIDVYLQRNELTCTKLSRGTAWLDTGTPSSLNDAATYIRVIEERTGLKIGCIEEISWRNGWITDADLLNLAGQLGKSLYGEYLKSLVDSHRKE